MAGAVLGAVFCGFGVYFFAGEPLASKAEVLSATATIIGQRTEFGSWPQSRIVLDASLHYFDSYSFTDEAGKVQTREDEVSAPFYLRHQVGSSDVAYFHPGGLGDAAIGSPLSMDHRQVRFDQAAALLLLLAGGVLIAWPVLQGRLPLARFRKLRGVRR